MDAFARIRTKSLLLKLWPKKSRINQDERIDVIRSNDYLEIQSNQKEQFLEEIKHGGAWFS